MTCKYILPFCIARDLHLFLAYGFHHHIEFNVKAAFPFCFLSLLQLFFVVVVPLHSFCLFAWNLSVRSQCCNYYFLCCRVLVFAIEFAVLVFSSQHALWISINHYWLKTEHTYYFTNCAYWCWWNEEHSKWREFAVYKIVCWLLLQ